MSHAEPAKSNAYLPLAKPRREPWLQTAMIGWIVLATAASIKTLIDPQTHTVYTTFSQAAQIGGRAAAFISAGSFFTALRSPSRCRLSRFGPIGWAAYFGI